MRTLVNIIDRFHLIFYRRDCTLLLFVRTFNRASENHARSELALCALNIRWFLSVTRC